MMPLLPSLFRLATPLSAGPGAIAPMILLMGQVQAWSGKMAVVALMGAMTVAPFLVSPAAPPIEKLRGHTGIIANTRLLGTLRAALAVQCVIDGTKGTGLLA